MQLFHVYFRQMNKNIIINGKKRNETFCIPYDNCTGGNSVTCK